MNLSKLEIFPSGNYCRVSILCDNYSGHLPLALIPIVENDELCGNGNPINQRQQIAEHQDSGILRYPRNMGRSILLFSRRKIDRITPSCERSVRDILTRNGRLKRNAFAIRVLESDVANAFAQAAESCV